MASTVDAFWLPVPYDIRDSNGTEVEPLAIGKWVLSHIKAISLGISNRRVDMGLEVNLVLPPLELGSKTAEQITRFISGESLEKIGIEKLSKFDIRINRSLLKWVRSPFPNNLKVYLEPTSKKK